MMRADSMEVWVLVLVNLRIMEVKEKDGAMRVI